MMVIEPQGTQRTKTEAARFSTLRAVRSLRLYAVEGNSRNSCLCLKEAGLPRLSTPFRAQNIFLFLVAIALVPVWCPLFGCPFIQRPPALTFRVLAE